VFVQARERTRNSLIALRSLVERLSLTPSPKTIILISEGLVIDRQLSEVSWLGAAASRGKSSLCPAARATDVRGVQRPRLPREPKTSRSARKGWTSSPDTPAARAPRDRHRGYGVQQARDRVVRILPPQLRAGTRRPGRKVHKISRDAATKRRRDPRAHGFAIDAVARKTEEAVLADTLRAPLLASEIPIRATAYTLRDPASDKLRIVVAAEIDRSLNPDGKVSLAFTLVDSQGKLVGSQFEAEVKTPVRPGSKLQTFTGSVFSESTGVHTLKLATLDDKGRRGSVEYSFEGRLTSAGQIRVTDFLIAENHGSANGGVVPAVSSDFTSAMLHGYVELCSDAIEVLKGATVVFEIAQSEQSRALDGVVAKVTARARIAQPSDRRGAVPIGLLSPGACRTRGDQRRRSEGRAGHSAVADRPHRHPPLVPAPAPAPRRRPASRRRRSRRS
jgi:hypothetical protein